MSYCNYVTVIYKTAIQALFLDIQTALGTVVLTSTLIMPSPAIQSLSLFLSIPLSLGQSINHDNALVMK
jgi:hypothetical protein